MSADGAPPTSSTPARRWTLRLGTLLLSLVAMLCVGEVVVRLVYPDPTLFERSDRWIAHPTLGRRLRPDHTFVSNGVTYTTNSLGLRDVERPARRPDGERRVVIVGDSFVYGVGPHATIFPQVTEQLLREQGHAGTAVLPVGQPGYGTLQQVEFVETFLRDLEFDALVLAFCCGNDLTENRRVLRGRLPLPPDPGPLARALEHSRLAQAVRGFRRGLTRDGQAKFDEHVATRMRLAAAETWERPGWRKAEEATLAAIERLAAFARKRGATFGVVLLPDEYQLDADLRERIAATAAFRDETGASEVRPRRVQERLGAALAERGIAVLDPFDAFAAAHAAGRLFLPLDTHYDADGNALLAREVASWLAARPPFAEDPK